MAVINNMGVLLIIFVQSLINEYTRRPLTASLPIRNNLCKHLAFFLHENTQQEKSPQKLEWITYMRSGSKNKSVD